MDATNGWMGNVKPQTIYNRKRRGFRENWKWQDIITAHVSQVVKQDFPFLFLKQADLCKKSDR